MRIKQIKYNKTGPERHKRNDNLAYLKQLHSLKTVTNNNVNKRMCLMI